MAIFNSYVKLPKGMFLDDFITVFAGDIPMPNGQNMRNRDFFMAPTLLLMKFPVIAPLFPIKTNQF
jgi:hypothetical protein